MTHEPLDPLERYLHEALKCHFVCRGYRYSDNIVQPLRCSYYSGLAYRPSASVHLPVLCLLASLLSVYAAPTPTIPLAVLDFSIERPYG